MRKVRAIESALKLINEAGCSMKLTDLRTLLRGLYKAGYHRGKKEVDLVSDDDEPRLPYL